MPATPSTTPSHPPLPAIIGAVVGGALLAILVVFLWLLFSRYKSSRNTNKQEVTRLKRHSNPNSLKTGLLGSTIPVSTFDNLDAARSLQSPSPVWLYDEKGRASPSVGSDSQSQASSRYGPPQSTLDRSTGNPPKISAPMPKRPIRLSTSGQSAPPLAQQQQQTKLPQPSLPVSVEERTTPVLSQHQDPPPPDNVTVQTHPPALGDHRKGQLQGILEDNSAVTARVRGTLSAGPGTRWLDKDPSATSGPPSRSRARIKEAMRETTYSRQSYMTATSVSVYSDHGPEPVGVAYGGEEYV